MKTNAKKLLLSLYSPDSHLFSLTTTQLTSLLPQLSPPGKRSLFAWLVKQGYVQSERVAGETHLHLTQQGNKAVESVFPVLHPRWLNWQGNWSCLVFTTAPSSDPEFRYLRKLLIDQGCLVLARGVYLYPDQFPERVQFECQSSYILSVVIFSIQAWAFGDERRIVTNAYHLTDITNEYSGVSNDVDRLISKVHSKKGLNDRGYDHFAMVFEKIYAVFTDDCGVTTAYFPQVGKPIEYLKKWQQLWKL